MRLGWQLLMSNAQVHAIRSVVVAGHGGERLFGLFHGIKSNIIPEIPLDLLPHLLRTPSGSGRCLFSLCAKRGEDLRERDGMAP